jgi:hypothetical protein
MTTDNSLVAFKAISNFCGSLNEVFGAKFKPVRLYARLISKTTLAHEKAIDKHLEAFRDFSLANRDALEAKNISLIKSPRIEYSQRVYLDISEILNKADRETTEIIWRHLLTISALVDPTSRAKQILKESLEKGDTPTEANFLNDIIGKVEEHVDPNANPMEAVASIMNSGVFSELIGGMGNGLQDGSLDLSKLMGVVQNMVSGLGDAAGNDTDSGGNPADLISTMMGSIAAGAQAGEGKTGPEGMPDLGNIMGMLGPMMNSLGSTLNQGQERMPTISEVQTPDANSSEPQEMEESPAETDAIEPQEPQEPQEFDQATTQEFVSVD